MYGRSTLGAVVLAAAIIGYIAKDARDKAKASRQAQKSASQSNSKQI